MRGDVARTKYLHTEELPLCAQEIQSQATVYPLCDRNLPGTPPPAGTRNGLSQKRDERLLRVLQLQFVRNRSRILTVNRKPEGYVTPLRVGGESVWTVERRVNLRAVEPARVALEMRSSRVEAERRRARNRPTRRPDSNVRSSAHWLQLPLQLAVCADRRRPASLENVTHGTLGSWPLRQVSSSVMCPQASTIARTSSRKRMSESSSKPSSMLRLRISRCAVSSLGGEWRSSASRTTRQRLGCFQRSCYRCAQQWPAGPASIRTRSPWP